MKNVKNYSFVLARSFGLLAGAIIGYRVPEKIQEFQRVGVGPRQLLHRHQ